MKLGKLISLVVMGALTYQHSDYVQSQMQFIANIVPVAQTYMEMSSFTSYLELYLMEHNGDFPEDIGKWLNANFRSHGKGDLGVDYFGTPYLAGWEDNDTPVLRSCGPDRMCYTDDDIVFVLAYGQRR